jgi:gliding motility-associated-like protein
MSKHTTLFLLVYFYCLSINAQYSCTSSLPLNSGIIACFPFTGNANDLKNNGNGVVRNAVLTTDRFGNCNEAYYFNGANGYIATYSTLLDNLNNFSVSFWIKIDEYPVTGSYVFAKGKEEPVLGDRLSWRCYIGGNPYKFIGTDNWFPLRYATTNPSTTNDWIHVVMTNDGSYQKVYINGTASDSIAQSGTLRTNPDSLYIGTRSLYGSRNQYFKGKLDEIVIWNRALSRTEVADIYFLSSQNEQLIKTQDTTVLCGSSFNMRASAGYTYLWTPVAGLSNPTEQNPTVNAKTTTKYVLKATLNGCDKYDSVLVTVTQPTIQTKRNENICPGDSVQLQVSGAQSYNWKSNATLSDTTIAKPYAKPMVTTVYFITANVNGCIVNDSVQVNITNNITANAGNDTSICRGDVVSLFGQGGSRFFWSPNVEINDTTISNPNIYPTQSRWYKLHTVSGLCEATDSVFIAVNEKPTLEVTDTIVCGVNNFFAPNVTATLADSYLWQPATYLSSPTVQFPQISPKGSIVYVITAKNTSTGCSTADTMEINLGNPKAYFSVSAPLVLIPGIVSLNNTSNPLSSNFMWYIDGIFHANNTHSQVDVNEAKKYNIKLVVTDSLGCTDSVVKVIEGKRNQTLFIPNVFSPNNDQINDFFAVNFDTDLYQKLEGTIWNRWGGKVAEFDGKKGNWWNGKADGNACPDGVYFYLINTVNLEGVVENLYGTITLLR